LDIPDVDVLQTEITADGKLVITVESQVKTTKCGCCGQEISCSYGHGQMIELRHLSVLGLETYIRLRPRRGQCKDCLYEPTTTQVLSWYEQRSPHTRAYDEYLLKQLVNSTIEDVSLKQNLGYDAIVGALNRQVDVEINWAEIEDLSTVGIDEIAMKKGHKNYAAIITARQAKGKVRVLTVLPDRKKRRREIFWSRFRLSCAGPLPISPPICGRATSLPSRNT
jgi:transposase